MFKEYHKIETLFERSPETKKLDKTKWRNPTVKMLRNCEWVFTEKIDGTNIRVWWDGHEVCFGGRTDKANIPKHLGEKLTELFGGETEEQMFEQLFGSKNVVLYGEGYGPKIQSGGIYRDDVSFVLFDVNVDGTWLKREAVKEIADAFGIDVVPVVLVGTLADGWDYVQNTEFSTLAKKPSAPMEGVVGRPVEDVFDRHGNRVIVKIKRRDMEG